MDFTQQMSMMPALSQGVDILSFLADFVCKDCGVEKRLEFACQVGKVSLLETMATQVCDRYQAPWAL